MTRTKTPSQSQLTFNARITATLRGLMRKNGATYRDLGKALGVSESTVKRLLNKGNFTLERLGDLADFFRMDTFDLLALAQDRELRSTELSEDQELYLAAHGNIAHYFFLLLHGMTPEELERRNGLTKKETKRYLETLIEINLGEYDAKGRFRLKYVWPLALRFNGPMQKAFARKVFDGFLNHLLEKVSKIGDPRAATNPEFTIRLIQLVLPRGAARELLREGRALIDAYLKESKKALATHAPEDLELVSYMVGQDNFNAFSGMGKL